MPAPLPLAALIVCAGAPEPRELSESVVAVTTCARSLLSIVSRYSTPTSGRAIRMRIGCHAGVVLGCVMGRSMVRVAARVCVRACMRDRHLRTPQPRYQLFGRDMDVVQAMEQSGEPNAIHVSAEFAAALREAGLPPGLALHATERRTCFLEGPDVGDTPLAASGGHAPIRMK
jgi:hypothetical protein